MTTLMQANKQWKTRPDDERFLSLISMRDHFETVRQESRESSVSNRRLMALPAADDPEHETLTIVSDDGRAYTPTHWSFGQMAQLADAPAGYLRSMPAPIAADCLNYGLKIKREISDVGVLVQHNHADVLRAATSVRYGRIWNADIVNELIEHVGHGVTGDWKVPGVRGSDVPITLQTTTFYGSDRDMFVFLADERNRIEIPSRRNGQAGSLAKGVFVWNSEVGSKTFGIGTFLFDYVCGNCMVWGAENYSEIRIRHTASAPDKFIEEMTPALKAYMAQPMDGIEAAVTAARARRIEKLDDFLANRFGKRLVDHLKLTHDAEEGRPIETLWDATTAATAYARGMVHQDERVAIERKAGELLKAAA